MTKPSRSTGRARPRLVMAVVCLALAAVVAAMSSLNVALPDIAKDTRATQTQLVWIVDAYSLAFASLLLPAGAIGDRYGRRAALITGLVLFGGGSAVAIAADSATELIAIRALLGVGAALVMPATLSTITSTFPADRRTAAVSVWAAVAGGAAVLGLLVSGLLLTGLSWRSIFALNVALSLLALIGTLRFVPESADPDAPRLDVGGALLAVLGLVALVYSVIEAPNHGWLAARTLIGFALAALALAGFVRWEVRHPHPLLDPRVFAKRALAAGSTTILIQFFAFYGFTFLMLQYLQLIGGATPLLAAVEVLPLAATMVPSSRLAPRLTNRLGTRIVCATGLAVLAVGLAVIAQVTTDTVYWRIVIGLVLIGIGMGAAMTPATSAITQALPPAQQGVGSALNDLSRELGGATGLAVIGSILSATYRTHVNVTGLPPGLADTVKASYALASHLGGPIANHAHAGFVDAMHIALLSAAGVALVAAVLVTVILAPGDRRNKDHDQGQPDRRRPTAPQPPTKRWTDRPAMRAQPSRPRSGSYAVLSADTTQRPPR